VIAIPALDLREGACVQLVGGDYRAERVRRDDPAAVLEEWVRCGFVRAHLIDLDAATERGSNASLVGTLIGATALEVQVGGGVRTLQHVQTLIEAGARYVVLGTRALEDPTWLAEVTHAFPGKMIVAADVRDRAVVSHGWQRTLSRELVDIISELNELPLAGVLVTAVHREGRMQGPDLVLAEDVAAACAWPTYVAGGIRSLSDLNALAQRGVAGAIIGMALYTGALDPRAVAQEFAA
jgi:phosphoribosylformimino-5-aminoimidazole carboxamide ribotide isomerase